MFEIHQDVILELLDIPVPDLQFLLRLVEQGLQLGHSHFLVDLGGVFDLLGGDAEPEGGDGFCEVVGVGRAGDDQGGFGVASQ